MSEGKAPVEQVSSTSPDKPEKKPDASRAFLMLILKLGIIAIIGWAALTYVFGIYRVSGTSMYPMLKDGDLCVTYRLEAYRSDDVVVYRVGDEVRFGRIVAGPGDTADGDELGLLVNGVHRSEEIFYPTQMLDTFLTLPAQLEVGQYLILNDHRDEFSDSRAYGLIDGNALEGKVIFFFRRRGF